MRTFQFSCCTALICFSSQGCGAARESTSIDDPGQAITGGKADDADVSAVFIKATVGTGTGYCSGVVVSPHVVLTAGHCATHEATYSIFLAGDYRDPVAKALATNYVAVAEHHAHPAYDPTRNLNDIGVLITAAPIPRPSVALNRQPLASSDLGQAIRIVGYGQTSGGDMTTIGRRTMGLTTIASFDRITLAMRSVPNICLFDSGGPTFLTRDGVDTVAGIHFIVDSASCDSTGLDVRVDPYLAFIDGYINAFDPDGAIPKDSAKTADGRGSAR